MRDKDGVVAFGGLQIAWAPSVLAPRTWTVAQSEWAIELLQDAPDGPILELCAGSGQIGLSTVVGTGRRLIAVDINPDAAECAAHNAREAGVGHLVEVRCASVEAALDEHESFPLILADPPWVPQGEIARYPDSPPLAIDGGDDGLRLALRCVGVMDGHLAPAGRGLLQLGSLAQVRGLSSELAARRFDLAITDHRVFPRGSLVLLERAGREREN